MLILFSGSACSWKSTIAARLSDKTGIPHLAMDDVRVRLMPGPKHTRAERLIALRAMNLAAELLLRQGASVILDAQYRFREDREEVAAIVEQTGARLVLIECMVSPEAAVRRFAQRGPDPVRVNLTPEIVAEMAREFVYTREGLVLDTDLLSVNECLALVEEYAASLRPAWPGPAEHLVSPLSNQRRRLAGEVEDHRGEDPKQQRSDG